MLNALRMAGFGLYLLALTAVCPTRVGAQVSPGATAYACVRLDSNGVEALRMITARQGCTSNETRMAVAASVNLLFSANALKPSGPDRSHIFASRIIPTIVSLPTSAPLLIAITLQVDTDNGMYTIPTAANDRGPSSA